MDNFFHRKVSDTQQSEGFLARLQQIFKSIIKWLISMFELTKEDIENAGVYPGEGRD